MKRVSIFVFGWVFAALLLAACGGGGATTDDASSELVDVEVETVEEPAPDSGDAEQPDEDASTEEPLVEEEPVEEVPVDLPRVSFVTRDAEGESADTDAVLAGLNEGAANGLFEVEVVVAEDFEAEETSLRATADTEPDLIVVAASASQGLFPMHTDFPDQQFLYLGGGSWPAENVSSVELESPESGYLAGVYAATLSDSGQLGFVGGEFVTSWDVFEAFTDGAQSVDPQSTVMPVFSSFDKQEGAVDLLASGVDVLLSYNDEETLDMVGPTVFNDAVLIAIQWRGAGDIVAEAPGNVGLVVEPDWMEIVQHEVELALSGETNRDVVIRLSNENLGFTIDERFIDAASGDRGARSSDVIAELDSVVEQLTLDVLQLEEPSPTNFEAFETAE